MILDKRGRRGVAKRRSNSWTRRAATEWLGSWVRQRQKKKKCQCHSFGPTSRTKNSLSFLLPSLLAHVNYFSFFEKRLINLAWRVYTEVFFRTCVWGWGHGRSWLVPSFFFFFLSPCMMYWCESVTLVVTVALNCGELVIDLSLRKDICKRAY
jgi:hypothetical protein